jgi:NADH-quinone oxidoreductase subunit N
MEIKVLLPEVYWLILAVLGFMGGLIASIYGLRKMLVYGMLMSLQVISQKKIGAWIGWNGHIRVDNYTKLLEFLMIILLILIVGLLGIYMKWERLVRYEYISMMLLSLVGMVMLLLANDLVGLYIAIEYQSLCLYILASMKKETDFSAEAALKYYILGALASGMFIYGCVMIYGGTGLLNYEEIKEYLECVGSVDRSIGAGIFFITIGLFFKIGIVPFHVWLPDVYEGVPTIITMYFSTVPKIVLIGVYIRVFTGVFGDMACIWKEYIIIGAMLSMLVGTLGALFQVKIKRIFAYSSITQLGYMIIVLITLTYDGMVALMLYLIVYETMMINLFTTILVLRGKKQKILLKLISKLGMLFKEHKVLALSITGCVLSLAGIPPFSGFYSKLAILIAIVKTENEVLVLILIALSAMAAVYYVRLIRMIFLNDRVWYNILKLRKGPAYYIAFTSILIMTFVLYNMEVILICSGEIKGI